MNKLLEFIVAIGFAVLVGIGLTLAIFPEYDRPCRDLERRVNNAAEGIHALKSKLEAGDDRMSKLEIAHNQLFSKDEQLDRQIASVWALLAMPLLPPSGDEWPAETPAATSSVGPASCRSLDSGSESGTGRGDRRSPVHKAKKRQPCAMGACW